jgi:hypothetical protein
MTFGGVINASGARLLAVPALTVAAGVLHKFGAPVSVSCFLMLVAGVALGRAK